MTAERGRKRDFLFRGRTRLGNPRCAELIDELLRKLVGAEIGVASALTILRQTEKLDIRITPQELLRGESWMN